jgi:hypothetical protein
VWCITLRIIVVIGLCAWSGRLASSNECKGTGVSSPEHCNRVSFPNVVFPSYLEFRTREELGWLLKRISIFRFKRETRASPWGTEENHRQGVRLMTSKARVWSRAFLKTKQGHKPLKQDGRPTICVTNKNEQTNSVAWVRERTIPTKRPLLVGEASANFCGYNVPRGKWSYPVTGLGGL